MGRSWVDGGRSNVIDLRSFPRVTREEELIAMISSPGSECIPWPYAVNRKGYGFLKFQGKSIGAHRAALILRSGIDPSGLHAAHQAGCLRSCCNPRHLRWASPSENEQDKIMDGTAPRGERNHRSILTTADVLAIRRSAEPSPVLAERFGVSARHVRYLKAGRFWEWLP